MKSKGMMIPTLIGTVALALPGLAPANGLDGTLIGELGAIGSYCSALQAPHDGAQAYLKELTRQLGAQTTGSADFRRAYDQMSDALAKLGKSQGQALCGLASSAAPGKAGGGR
jgi:gas vesicle protein